MRRFVFETQRGDGQQRNFWGRCLVVTVLLATFQSPAALFFNTRNRKQAAKNPIDETCVEKARLGDCGFYTCFDERHPCGKRDNYAIKYGWRFCSRFDLYHDDLSTAGKRWLNGTRLCSMEKLLEFYRSDAVSCSEVEDTMMEGHASCEAENGLCQGRVLLENREVFSDVYALNRRSSVQLLQTVKQCTLQKVRDVASWFGDQLHNFEDAGQSVYPLFKDLEKKAGQLKGQMEDEFARLRQSFKNFGSKLRRGTVEDKDYDDDDA